MGLTTWKGAPKGPIRKADAEVAKNYLTEEEFRTLNLLVDQYLSFAEFQAQQRRTMTMLDWARKLDDFLKLNERPRRSPFARRLFALVLDPRPRREDPVARPGFETEAAIGLNLSIR